MGDSGKIQDVYSLTPMQEGMLFHSLAEPSSQMYHELLSVRLRGSIDSNAIEESLRRLVKRHDILRTVFLHKNIDKPRQVVLKERKTDFTYVDIRHFNTREEKEKYIADFKDKDQAKTFDLSKHILFRMALLQIENEEYELYILHHHIIMDGWSTGIFFNEFFSIYDDIKKGKESGLLPATPFSHYIKWLNNRNKDASKAFWREYLNDYNNNAVIPGRSGFQEFGNSYKQSSSALTLDASRSRVLNRIAAENELTLYNIMKALWGILLAKYNQQNDVVFGTVVSGRPPDIDGIESMIGLFINTIPTRVKMSESMSFIELFEETQRQSASAQGHHYVALSDILNESELRRNLFNHLLAFENYPLDRGQISEIGQMSVENISLYEQANYGLSIIIMPGDEIAINFVYNENEYDHDIISGVLSSYSCILDQLLLQPQKRIKDIELIPEIELNKHLTVIHDTQKTLDETLTISGLIEKQAYAVPEKVAIIEGEKKITYQQLNLESAKIARYLIANNVGPGSIVGVMMTQSVNMAVAINAILKSGAAFLPIDPNYPEKRIEYLIKDSCIKILLYDDDRYPEYVDVEMVNIHQILLESDCTEVCDMAKATGNAYVIYTSGSTGQPKGVAISHKSAVNLLLCHIDKFRFNPDDICLELFSFSFDAFILSYFTPLCAGASVILIKDDERGDPAIISEYIGNYKVTNINCIPTLFNGIVQHISEEQAASLRLIQLGGEKIERSSIDTIITKNKSVEVAQEYGVTEASVASTVQRNQQNDPVLKIGKSIWNTYVYVLDQHKKILPCGVPGELHIGGTGISSGYINNEKLTEEKFIINPYRENEQMYATGDIGRWDEDGAIEFLRRKDTQVKIRGYRIEINEVQSALKMHPDIFETVVVDKKDTSGNNCLFAYFVPKKHLEIKGIREYLSERIPGYMIPGYFLEMQKLPVTPNGKIDILGLKQRKDEIIRTTGFCEPKNEIERILVNIWQEVLGIEHISTTDDYFELGGDSVKSIQIRSRLNRAGYHIELTSIFQNPTIIEAAKRVTSNTVENEITEDTTSPLPVMPSQFRFLRIENSEFSQPITAGLLVSDPPISIENFEHILSEVYSHHDALRMRFFKTNDRYFQSIQPTVPGKIISSLEEIDINDTERLEQFVKSIADTFNVAQGQLFSASYISGGKKSAILLVVHQALMDAYSFKILFEDIGILLHQLLNDTMLKLPPVSTSYKKVLEIYNAYNESDSVKKDSAYWNSVSENELIELNTDDGSIGTASVELSEYVPGFLSGKVNKAFNTNSEDILLTVNALTVKNVMPKRNVSFHVENPCRGSVVDGLNNLRILGSFQTGYPVCLDSVVDDDLAKTIKGIKEVMHQVPGNGLPYAADLMRSDTTGCYDNERIVPSFAFQFTRLDWIHAEHLSFNLIKDPMQSIIAMNKPMVIAFNWKLEPDKLNVTVHFRKSLCNEILVTKVIDQLRANFKSICDFCLGRDSQSLTPSDFTYKGISLDEFDSIESFFKK
jgi:amino acid adenylation domain-containing protein/non-ribosomal peptide synthase protein (TIGR01720 family)